MLRATHVWLAIGVLCATVPAAHAQTFEAGVKVGLAITGLPHAGEVVDQIVGAPSGESSSKVGLTGGGYVTFPITSRIGFQPEALFVMRGVDLHEAAANGGTVNVRFNYLDVPLLLKYRATDSASTDPKISGYVFGGPNFGIGMSSSAKLDAPGITKDLDVEPAFKTLDVGLTFGGGVECGRYLLEGRFTAGLTDVASTTYVHADSIRNQTFSILVGMKLR